MNMRHLYAGLSPRTMWSRWVAVMALVIMELAALLAPVQGFAAASDFTDVPLRTRNRAKPNILFFLDNGVSTQYTFTPDGFRNALQRVVRDSNNDTSGLYKVQVQFNAKKFGVANNNYLVSNNNAYADSDWHYRASGKYVDGTACSTVCTLNGRNAGQTASQTCTANPCTDVFNQLYYTPSVTYQLPRGASGSVLHLPQTVYASSSAARSAGCNCTDLVKCAWLDGYDQSKGCVDLKKTYSTAPYPPEPGQLLPWSVLGGGPTSATNAYAPIVASSVKEDGIVTYMAAPGVPAPNPPGTVADTGSASALIYTGTVYAPGDAGNPFAGWYSYNKSGATTFNTCCTSSSDCPDSPEVASTYYPSTCTVDSGTVSAVSHPSSCPSGQRTVTLNNLWCRLTTRAAPGSWSSPFYCDTRYQGYKASLGDTNSDQDYRGCQKVGYSLSSSSLNHPSVYSNSGPADFFEPNGKRYVITREDDQRYFYSSTSDETRNNFSIWHSFYRTRLLALKSSLNLSMYNANLTDNFRVGLATLMNGVDGTQYTFGASAASATHYFSAVADFSDSISPPHKTEWYNQLAKVQMAPAALNTADYVGTLHNLYLWFVGSVADPSVPTGFMTQRVANTTANLGAASQYASAAPSRTGPLMYSCQANGLIYLLANRAGPFLSTPGYPNLKSVSGACEDPYPTAYESGSTPCEISSGPVTLPSYVTSFYDSTAYPLSRSGVAGVTYTRGEASWPYPFKASTGNFYQQGVSGLPKMSSMADLALYYWSHDLNQEFNSQAAEGVAVDVPLPNGSGKLGVPPFGNDLAYWPHVTTYLINLTQEGYYNYNQSSTLTNFYNGTNSWPVPSLQDVARSDASRYNTSVDDMVHAAFNGHGRMLAATDSTTLGSAFSSAFSDILALSGSESAVSVANTQVSQAGTSYAFQSSYNSSGWWGDLVASTINPTTGAINSFVLATPAGGDTMTCTATDATSAGWSAKCKLRDLLCPGYLPGNACSAVPGVNHSSRIVVTDNGGGSASGIPFAYSNLSAYGLATQLKLYATDHGSALTYLRNNEDNATSVISYIRGDSTNESCTTGATSGYRCRGSNINSWNPMGDVVDAEAIVIGPPLSAYTDSGYGAFKAAQSARTSVVFQAANDGMVHAFRVGDGSNTDATRGTESWSYIPSYVLPNLKQLASLSYSHQYYVNATPAFGDVNIGTSEAPNWRTILVGGLGKGGKGYYALDVTTPTATSVSDAASKVIWTFPSSSSTCGSGGSATVPNVGYTYGRPLIVKIPTGSGTSRWVVIVSSGYDNSDYVGHIYILDAGTGACLKDISTGTGSSGSPAGLTYLGAKVIDPYSDATATAVYGGDLLGNVWKFGPGLSGYLDSWTASRFAVLRDYEGNVQPVASEPNMAVSGTKTMLLIGTGRYLGAADVPSNADFKADAAYVQQSMYGLLDDDTDYATVNARTGIRNHTGSDGGAAPGNLINGDSTVTRTGYCNSFTAANCTVQSPLTRCLSCSLTSGRPWVFDLPAGERIITTPVIALGSLLFTSNQPIADPCQPGGASYLYVLDYLTGGAALGAPFVSQGIRDPVTGDNVMASRPTVIQLPDGRVQLLLSTSSGVTLQVQNVMTLPARRVSWREVPQ